MAVHQEDYSTWDIVKATQYGYMFRCKELVEAGYDVRTPDADNITPLHWAAINNRLEIARYYISLGAVVDVLGGDLLATPLHWAIREGHHQMVALLMQCGADPGVRDAEGCAAVHVAVQCGYTGIVAYLIAKGVDPDLYDANGKTPLMWAAWRIPACDMTRALLSLYASVNMKDSVQRNSPLHWACLAQNANVIILLVNASVDLDAKNEMGETALDIAKAKKDDWAISKLQRARREKGLDVGYGCITRMVSNKTLRQRSTFFVAFFTMFCVGFLFEVSTPSWFHKAFLFAVCYVVIYGVSSFFITKQEITTVLPLAVSFATKFWVYVTSFLYFWPVVYSPLAQLSFMTCTPGMWYFFYKAYKADPGIISTPEEAKKRTIIHLSETTGLKIQDICCTCLLVKPLRSKHCVVTNKCVAKYDHYCPWVFNAIGSGNHHYFLAYLCFLLGMLSWNVYGAFMYWGKLPPAGYEISSLHRTWQIIQYSPWVAWIFIHCCFHLLWVFILLLCQLYQIAWLGATTNERMNATRYPHFQTSKIGNLEHSPFDRGVLNNLADFFQCSCFGLLKPLNIDWRTRMKFAPEFQIASVRKSYENV